MAAALAGAAGDCVDAATLSFLTARALEDRRKEEDEEEKAKKTPRRFSGRVFKPSDAQEQCGFIDSGETRAALALERDFPFSAGSFFRHG